MKEQISKLKEQLIKERHLRLILQCSRDKCHCYSCRQEVMEELLELQRVKEKEQVEQTRSLKEANAEIRRQKNNQDMMSQKVVPL